MKYDDFSQRGKTMPTRALYPCKFFTFALYLWKYILQNYTLQLLFIRLLFIMFLFTKLKLY